MKGFPDKEVYEKHRRISTSGGSNPGLAGRLSWWAIDVEAIQIADSSDTASQFLPGGVAAIPTKVGMTGWGLGMDGWQDRE